MNKIRLQLIASTVWIVSTTIQAQTSGHVKFYPILPKEDDTQFLLNTRINQDGFLNQSLSYEVQGGFSLLRSSQLSLATTPTDAYRIKDIKKDIWQDKNKKTQLTPEVDRLNLRWDTEASTVTIGRQAIFWGAGRIANPTDVFLPFTLTQIDSEYRIGVDGLRWTIPTGTLSEWDLGFALGKKAHPNKSAAFARYRHTLWETDWEWIAINFLKAQLIGLAAQRPIGEAAGWFEVSYVASPEGTADYAQGILGIETFIDGELYLMAEYYHNTAGAKTKDSIPSTIESFAYRQGGLHYLRQNYLVLGSGKHFTPIIELQLQILSGLDDGSHLLIYKASYNATENSYLDLGIFMPWGAKNGEFTDYSQLVYGSARYYF